MRLAAVVSLLVLLGCASNGPTALAQTPPPDPPNPGYYYYNGDVNLHTLRLFSSGKVQIQTNVTVLIPFLSTNPSGCSGAPYDSYTFTYAILLEGNYTNYGVTGGFLKSLWTDEGSPGIFWHYWQPDANHVAQDVLNTFDISAPWSATWDGSAWHVTCGGGATEINCPRRFGDGNFIGDYTQ